MRVEIDGGPPTAAALHHRALVNYGHFTSMQVRAWRVRGLDLHLRRLRDATVELFGTDLDPERVRGYLRSALGDDGAATVRVDVFRLPTAQMPSVMVSTRPPTDAPTEPQRLRSVVFQRAVAHLKHAGTFPQIYYGGLAGLEGFDDALFVGADGAIFEGGITNIGFVERDHVVWPEGPVLAGVTMQLLERALPVYGMSTSRDTVRLSDVDYFSAVFVSNSTGVAPVGRVDAQELSPDENTMVAIRRAYQAIPWDPI
jgi:branched-subunit amino acid aminotransferase/4-amino-4-deoxychorismate lyase